MKRKALQSRLSNHYIKCRDEANKPFFKELSNKNSPEYMKLTLAKPGRNVSSFTYADLIVMENRHQIQRIIISKTKLLL